MVGSVHPILDATATVRTALASVAQVSPVFMATPAKAAALAELAAAESQLVELKLRVLAEAGDLADETGARDAAAWLAHHTHGHGGVARSELRLATALDRRYPQVAAAMRQGRASVAQAGVITRGLDRLPAEVPDSVVAEAEETLVGHCAEFGPRPLAKLARHVLDVVAPEIAEAAEAKRLADEEADAAEKTRLSLRRQGDGTTRLSGLIPDADAIRLTRYLEAFTNPRKQAGLDELDQHQDSAGRACSDHHPRKLGQAFCKLLETWDPTTLPDHGGEATTVVVTITLEQLLADLATATLDGDLPGGGLDGLDTDDEVRITAAQARRLACNAHLVPAVLGTDSEVLDLGRKSRLFSSGQHRALRLRDKCCRAEGCDIPGTWAEAHHLHPWSLGGRTDLADGVLLCRHHHQLIHQPDRTTSRLPNGDLRFHPRT